MKPNRQKLSRREFLKRTAGVAVPSAAFPAIIPSTVLGADGAVAPGNRITIGCIGTGPQGIAVMGGLLAHKNGQVVAVCDVKSDQREHACAAVNQKYQNRDCKSYVDFRELLARRDIDACLIAAPDHWHVPMAIAAVRAGKDVYVEKPMGCSVAEGQAMRRAVRETGRIFQFGTQQRSDRNFRTACEIARSGLLGRLKTIHVWSPGSAPGGSTKAVPVPATLDYERWLGPAPFKPYAENRCDADGRTKTWWFDTDYAVGFIAGWGIHPMDIALWGAGDLMKGVVELEGTGKYPTDGACNTATHWDVRLQFETGLKVIFAGTPNGGKAGEPTGQSWPHAEEWRSKFGAITTHGTVFEGTDGWVRVQRGEIATSTEALAVVDRKVRLKTSSNHAGDFLEAIASRQPAISHVEDAVCGDTLCQISDIAARLQRKLRFDFKTERFLGDSQANQRLRLREMRAPWKLS